MDNAPYHSVRTEKIPTTSWNKQQIIDWLQSKGKSMDITYLKKELLMKVAEIAPQYNKYLIDETSKNDAIALIDANRWKKCCDHVIREENTMWNLDHIMELAEQNSFIINVTGESSDID
ncbi:unnamed protein product [Parnassius mnemosyne]